MDTDKLLAALKIVGAVPAHLIPLLKTAIERKLFVGPLAKLEPYVVELEQLLELFQLLADMVLPTFPVKVAETNPPA